MRTSTDVSVYLVDDDKLFSTALSDQIKKMFNSKATIKTFSTGEDCLKHFENPPSIIILDYFLNSSYPDAMNGLQILKKINQANPETKVIMLSAQDKIEVAVNTIKNGAYDYVIKNDNVFLRTKLAISNASNAVAATNELKSFKRWVKIGVGIIAIVVAICVALQIYFPSFLKAI